MANTTSTKWRGEGAFVTLRTDWKNFHTLKVPSESQSKIVYVICFTGKSLKEPVPFYVGRSKRHVGRLGDYVSGKFTAVTDFRVGVAIRYLQKEGFRVDFHFTPVSDPKQVEQRLKEELKTDNCLLNDKHLGKGMKEAQAREAVCRFMGDILKSLGRR